MFFESKESLNGCKEKTAATDCLDVVFTQHAVLIAEACNGLHNNSHVRMRVKLSNKRISILAIDRDIRFLDGLKAKAVTYRHILNVAT